MWPDAGPDVSRPPSPVQELRDERLSQHAVRAFLKRDDLLQAELPGNKWRKLKYNLAAARDQGFSTLLTFGGAYSNHLRATAAAGHRFGFSTVGVVRGEEHYPLNQSLRFAASNGMRLTYMDRTTYRRKATSDVIDDLRSRFGDFYLLPEGGSNPLAVRGCAELPGELDIDFDLICCPVGTGGTLAGIAGGLEPGRRALGFSSLKGGQFLTSRVAELQRRTFGFIGKNWSINCDYHFGGFAKSTGELHRFLDDFDRRHRLKLDWVYVGKMIYGVFDLTARRRFAAGSTIVMVVTGPPDI